MAVSPHTPGAGDAPPDPGVRALSERVKGAIVARQVESERLVGWIQLTVVGAFAVLYAVARESAPADAAISLVPLALAAFAAFTLLRLVLAYRGWLPGWFLGLSAVVEVVLLSLLIWSFHVQYAQPAAFYLKSPTWAYLFILIALRALSFDPRYVVTAGIAALVAWAGLVAYAMLEGRGPITRDYVEYLTSASVLLGAEIDKLITIAIVTAILALALHRGRELMIAAAIEAQAARDLARFFTPEIALHITSAARPLEPGHGELCDAAILQVDLKGFTCVAARLPPDRVVGLLIEYHAQVAPVIRRHGGSVDKFLGDGVIATFGAARPSATYAADALRAALELVEVVRAWSAARVASEPGLLPAAATSVAVPASSPLAVSVAVASGELVVGALGDPDRLEYTVIGNPVNLAAKLEKHTRVEQVAALTTADTLARARAQSFTGAFAPPRRRAVAGLAAPVDIIVLAP